MEKHVGGSGAFEGDASSQYRDEGGGLPAEGGDSPGGGGASGGWDAAEGGRPFGSGTYPDGGEAPRRVEYTGGEEAEGGPPGEGAGLPDLEVNPLLVEGYLQELRYRQNLSLGILAGLAAAALGAAAWVLASSSGSFMELRLGLGLGTGLLVGFAVRRFGQGIDPVFGVAAAAVAICGCAAGIVLSCYAIHARNKGIPFREGLRTFPLSEVFEAFKAHYKAGQFLLFLGLPAYLASKTAVRAVTLEEIERAGQGNLAQGE
jgi:hypothetical protein